MSRYGNYKPDFNLEGEKSILGRLRAFWIQKCVRLHLNGKTVSERSKCASFLKCGGGALIIFLALMLGIYGCKTQHTVIKEETVTRYVDSTIWHTDTTYYQLPVEVYSDYTGLLDTLRMENTYSYTWSAVDTNNMLLVGELRNKDIKIPVQYLWKDRIITNDSIIEKVKEIQVPYPVEKRYIPTIAWICIVWTLITLISIGWVLYKRLKR